MGGSARSRGRSAERRRQIYRRRAGALAVVALLAGAVAALAASGGGGEEPKTAAAPRASHVPLLDTGRPLPDRLALAAGEVERLAREDPGELGVALAPIGEGPLVAAGELREGGAWSAMKVPLAAAFLRLRAEASRMQSGTEALTRRDRELVADTLRSSDNQAAEDLYAAIADRAGGDEGARRRLQDILWSGGDVRTQVSIDVGDEGLTEFGSTEWRLEDALAWYRTLGRGCLMPAPDTRLLLTRMSEVVSEQRWGLPKAVGTGTPIAFKGGWGPGPDLRWLVEQVAIVGQGEFAYVAALMARAPTPAGSRDDPSSFDAGRRLLEKAATEIQAAVGPPGSGPGAKPADCRAPR